MRFRKKPVVIEAVRFSGENVQEIAAVFVDMDYSTVGGPFKIFTAEGDYMTVTPGDWVIKGISGEFYPCKPNIFEATYEAVDGPKPNVMPELPKLIIPIKLWCPHCGVRHIDESRNGERWDRRAHTTHRCQACGGDFDVYVSGAVDPSKAESS